ncbi:MAG: hypothetical protein ACLPX8_12915 [Bryobacteraceae bacterium]|jgi:hypothetical protein
MADLYALTSEPLPKTLHGADGNFSIRTLSDHERIAIEDHFFKANFKIELPSTTTAVVVAQNETDRASMEEFAVLVEFALAVLTVSGFQPVTTVATFNATTCTDGLERPDPQPNDPPTFAKKVVKGAASTWLRHFFAARRKAKDKLHVTADRFVRYSRTRNSLDSLLDLCICLESLIDSQTEISFRFGTCLAKVIGGREAEETSDLLSDLYDFRSRVVHGADATKEHRKVDPHRVKLRFLARSILTGYVLYLTEHTKDEWKRHLRSALFA